MKIPFYTRGPKLVAHVVGQFDTLVADLDLAAQHIQAKKGKNAARLAKIAEQQAALGKAHDRAVKVAARIAQLVAE